METVSVTLNIPKETYELFNGLFKVVSTIKESLADGWDPSIDIPVIITKSLVELSSMVQGVDQIPVEFKNDPATFVKAAVISGADIAGLFLINPNTSNNVQ